MFGYLEELLSPIAQHFTLFWERNVLLLNGLSRRLFSPVLNVCVISFIMSVGQIWACSGYVVLFLCI